MKIIHEAIVGDYHFIVSMDYLTITKNGEELVHLPQEQMFEAVGWLHAEASAVYQALNKGVVAPVVVPETQKEIRETSPDKMVEKRPQGLAKSDMDERRAKVKAPLTLGDPDLAGRAPDASPDGRQRIFGVEDMDLGELARTAGKVLS